MLQPRSLGFGIRLSEVVNGIFVPKYYDPDIRTQFENLESTHDLVTMRELVKEGVVSYSSGDEVGKMAYGTGGIPFIRTSDIASWELKADPKQGLSEDIYQQYAGKQDVQEGDILFVRDGTYLVGNSCIVGPGESKIVYQSHLVKFRVAETDRINPHLFLAVLTSPVVRQQIRAKQFTADIIDMLGSRFLELVLPIPRDTTWGDLITQAVKYIVEARAELKREVINIPRALEGLDEEEGAGGFALVLPPGGSTHLGFSVRLQDVKGSIFVPKYYNPEITERLDELCDTHDPLHLGTLVKQGALELETGVEVGKMAYAGGVVPFVRTSDISNWEIKANPKQRVSEELYEELRGKLDVQAGDILLVRDGTYLVGLSCILTKHDTKMLYCGGLYKMRSTNPDKLDPYVLFASLNSPIVRQQIRSKQFTRDVIDTLGKRIRELVLPIPKDVGWREDIIGRTRRVVEGRTALRERIDDIAKAVLYEDELDALKEDMPAI